MWTLSLHGISGTMVQACGLAIHYALEGIKYRLTYNLSFSITGEDASINSRCDMGAYPENFYSFCLSRIIHFIVAFRRRFPNKNFFISKYNYWDVYWRMAHKALSAIHIILAHAKRAYIYLRLTFGASVNPAMWYRFSEMICDLSNEMTLIGNWDPDILSSPIQPEVPDPVYIDPSVSLAPARAMTVEVPTTSLGRGDCCLDDNIKVFLARLSIIK